MSAAPTMGDLATRLLHAHRARVEETLWSLELPDPAEWIGLCHNPGDGGGIRVVHADCEDCLERLCDEAAQAMRGCWLVEVRRDGAWVQEPGHA